MVAGPKRKLMNSAPASYCLYSTPGARTMTAMTRAGDNEGRNDVQAEAVDDNFADNIQDDRQTYAKER